ncbi:MAG: alpha/beta fold hydrolase, partial [Arenicellales bacterium]
MRQLYPDIKPNQTWQLQRGIHGLYIEECGNPAGIPVVFLHGGPGTGCSPAHRRFFNPEEYRIILFDQRGCGRST